MHDERHPQGATKAGLQTLYDEAVKSTQILMNYKKGKHLNILTNIIVLILWESLEGASSVVQFQAL